MIDRRTLNHRRWEPRIQEEDYSNEMRTAAQVIDAYPAATKPARKAAAKILCGEIAIRQPVLSAFEVQREALAIVKAICPRTDPEFRNRTPGPAMAAIREHLREQGDLSTPTPRPGGDEGQAEKSPEIL